jgi:hypothetical protein
MGPKKAVSPGAWNRQERIFPSQGIFWNQGLEMTLGRPEGTLRARSAHGSPNRVGSEPVLDPSCAMVPVNGEPIPSVMI